MKGSCCWLFILSLFVLCTLLFRFCVSILMEDPFKVVYEKGIEFAPSPNQSIESKTAEDPIIAFIPSLSQPSENRSNNVTLFITRLPFVQPVQNKTKDSTMYELVLFTTEDGISEKKIRKLTLFRDMATVYAKHFRFRAILFSSTPRLKQLFQNSSVLVLSGAKVNPFGLPIITSMFAQAETMLNAEYYGYMNSDILLDPRLFEVLHYCRNSVIKGKLARAHEIAGRVYEREWREIPAGFISLKDVSLFFRNYSRQRAELRPRGSADYFVFSREAMRSVTNERYMAVIGRMRIDNFLMGAGWQNQSESMTWELVDATMAFVGIHEGKEGFYKREVVMQTRENRGWNYGVMQNMSTHYGYLSEKGNRVLHRKNDVCCTIATYTK